MAGFGLMVALVTVGCDRNGAARQEPQSTAKSQPTSEPAEPEKPLGAASQEVATAPEPRAELRPVDPVKLQELTVEALESGDLETAYRLVRVASSIAPDDPPTIFLKARVWAGRNRFAEAIRMLDELAEDVPDARLPVLGQTAEWLVFQGDWREAEKRYRELLAAVGDARVVDRKLSQLLLRQGRRLEAATHLRKLCRFGDVDESELRSLLMMVQPLADQPSGGELEPIGAMGDARLEMSRGNWEAAREKLEQATSKAPAESALWARVLAQASDFDSLGKWAADASESEQETADYWFAIGVHRAHQEDHAGAVVSFCEAVLRDPTDHQAYGLMSRSLNEIGADAESGEASERAKLIQQTQEIGNRLVTSSSQESQSVSTLIQLLGELQRPFESLGWRALQVVYGQSDSAISNDAARQTLDEINRDRLEQLETDDPEATRRFILCGVDLDALRRKIDVD